MSTVKVKIDKDVVLSYLKENFDSYSSDLVFINGGEMSQAFSFKTGNEEYVVRVNANSRSFYKDDYAFRHFGNNIIPIPEIIKIGKLDEYFHFAISRKAEGIHVNKIDDDGYSNSLISLLGILDEIHNVNISGTKLYGKWNLDGNGEYKTWREFILAVDHFDNREELFETSFLESDVWKLILSRIKELSEFCPEERFLVHGDYGSDNVIYGREKVSGVLDWSESMYGDYIYDIAWLSFWTKQPGRIKEIEDNYISKNIPNFGERLLCYKLRIGLGSLSFYAYSKQRDKYDSIKQRTLNLL